MASYTSLESGIIQEVGGPALTFDTTQVSTFFASVSFLWTLGIMVCVAATGFVWVKGGLFRMEASEAGIRKSNEEFKRGTLGLLGVLSLFLIIYTINKGLLLGDVGLDALKSGGVTPATGATEETPTGTTPASGTGGTGSVNLATLNAAGIQINHGNVPCTAAQMTQPKPACTSVEGLAPATITMLLALRTACPACNITVTGGTEPGHSLSGNHRVGGRAVDLNKNQALDTFLAANCRPTTPARCGWGGYTFYDEPAGANANTTAPHYHVD